MNNKILKVLARLAVALLTATPFTSPIFAAEPDAAALAKKNAEENAAIRKEWASWNTPFKPFRLIGNIYYVGPSGISSFLITTPQGHILLDTGFETTVPGICQSITNLGFKIEDIKIILNSHAHTDHAGGHARMKQLTHAKILMSAADAALLASGGTNDFTPYSHEMMGYHPAAADQILHDGEKVTLGGVTMTCHLTPGHTKGCTTWTTEVTEDKQVHHVVFFGSTSILSGVPLVNNTNYPNIAEDLAQSFRTLKTLPCDVFLAPHAGFFSLKEKSERFAQRANPNPFINPHEYRDFIEKQENNFRKQLEAARKQ